jgi:hypothetical protein
MNKFEKLVRLVGFIIRNDQSLRVLNCSYLIPIGILLIHGNRVYFPEAKWPRHIIKHPLLFSVKFKERVELHVYYLYYPSGNLLRVLEHFLCLFIYLWYIWRSYH